MKCTTKFLLVLALGASAASHANTLELDQFVQHIRQHNPGVQRILEQQAIAAGQLEASRGIDDPLLTGGTGFAHTEPDRINGFEAQRSNDLNINAGISRTFSQTGTRLNGEVQDRYIDRSPGLASELGASYYQPSLTLRLTQPLLKNRGGLQDRLNIELNQLNQAFAVLNAQEQLESYFTQLATLYLDWYQAYRETAILELAHQKVAEQEQLVELKVRRQIAEPYELLRIQETRADYYSRWQQAQGRYQGLGRRIEKQMNLPRENTPAEYTPADPEASALLRAKTERAPDYLREASRLQALLDNLEQQQQQLLDASQDARQADLDVSVSYTRHGVDDDLVDAHGRDLDRDDYALMLEYRYPLGNRAASGDYRARAASKRQVQADTTQQLIDAEAALADLQAREHKLQVALAAADHKIALATRKLAAEQELYRIGQLDLFELQQDATTQLESRINRSQLYVQLQQLRLSIGELLDRNLPEQMSTALPTGDAR